MAVFFLSGIPRHVKLAATLACDHVLYPARLMSKVGRISWITQQLVAPICHQPTERQSDRAQVLTLEFTLRTRMAWNGRAEIVKLGLYWGGISGYLSSSQRVGSNRLVRSSLFQRSRNYPHFRSTNTLKRQSKGMT